MSPPKTPRAGLEEWESYFQRPTGWIVAGIFLFLMSSGAFTYKMGDHVFALSGILDKFYSLVVSMLSIVLITVGTHSASRHWEKRRFLVDAMLVVFWLLSMGAAGYQFIADRNQPYPFNDVTFDYWKKEMTVELSTPYLFSYKRAKFILAVTNTKLQNEYNDSENVSFSEPFDAPQSPLSKTVLRVGCARLGPRLKIGDVLRVYLIKLEKDNAITTKTRISDIDNGGENILRKYRVDVGVFKNDPATLKALYSELTSGEQRLFLTLLKGDDR